MHRGNVWRGLCPAWLGGLWDARRPLCSLPGIGELLATGVCPTCKATAALSATLLWGAHNGAAAGPWARARFLCEPRAQYRASQDICQVRCPPSSPCFFPQVAACQGPQSPDQPPASCRLCLPLPQGSCGQTVPGISLLANSHSSLAHLCPAGSSHWASLALRCLFWGAGGCWILSALVRGCSEMGRELTGSNEPPVGATVLCLCSNIIDVSAADSQGMEQHEYMDRARQYRWDLRFSPGVPTVPSQLCVSLGRSQGFWPGLGT